MPIEPVRREVVIDASQAHVFRIFTENLGAWWPLASHHIGEKEALTAIIEPKAGGRWYERAADGTECQWGRVKLWDPPGRLVLLWQIAGKFKYDPKVESEVEVRFVAMSPTRTRVELEHRDFEGMGEMADMVRGAVDSPGGWTQVMQIFAQYVEKSL
jgi:uncharacterized protein YndB with AHSA1/START domain